MEKNKKKDRDLTWWDKMCWFFSTLFQESLSLMYLNMLFILSCIPIFTLPMALSALLRVTNSMINGDSPGIFATYKRFFLQRPKRVLKFGWIFCSVWIALVYSYAFYGLAGNIFMMSIALLFCFFLLIFMLYLLPELSKEGDMKLKELTLVCLERIFNRVPQTIFGIFSILGFVFCQIWFFWDMIPVIFLLGASLPAFIASSFMNGMPENPV